MKKIFLTSVALASLVVYPASAQSYNPNYPSNVPNNYYSYGAQPQRRASSSSAFKRFSIGFDYVLGSTSMDNQSFTLDNPLVGGESYTGNTDKFEDSIDSLNFNLGFRPWKYLGLEAFYQQSLSDNQVKYQESYSGDSRFAQAEYEVKYKAYGLDAIGYIPLASRFELLASVGVAQYDFDAKVDFNAYKNTSMNKYRANSLKMDDSKLAFRYGGGAQIWLSQRLAFRAMYRYTSIGGDYFDDVSEISLGLRYNF